MLRFAVFACALNVVVLAAAMAALHQAGVPWSQGFVIGATLCTIVNVAGIILDVRRLTR